MHAERLAADPGSEVGTQAVRARLIAAGALFASFAVSALFTFPLILKLTTHFPGAPVDEDVFGFIWNNWWISYSTLERHQSPLTTTYLLAPFEVDLRLHTFGL